MGEFKEWRRKMVEEQIAGRGIQDPNVLKAMGNVPREKFVQKELVKFAYEDTPLPIDEGQITFQPYMVALMAEQARITSQDKVLEIGTGSGYLAAVLSHLASPVYSIVWNSDLAMLAQQRLQSCGYKNIVIRSGEEAMGWEEFAPYDAILVTTGGPQIPSALLNQLAIGGRLIIPIGSNLENQDLMRVTRVDEKSYHYETLTSLRLVPFLGEEGWY